MDRRSFLKKLAATACSGFLPPSAAAAFIPPPSPLPYSIPTEHMMAVIERMHREQALAYGQMKSAWIGIAAPEPAASTATSIRIRAGLSTSRLASLERLRRDHETVLTDRLWRHLQQHSPIEQPLPDTTPRTTPGADRSAAECAATSGAPTASRTTP